MSSLPTPRVARRTVLRTIPAGVAGLTAGGRRGATEEAAPEPQMSESYRLFPQQKFVGFKPPAPWEVS